MSIALELDYEKVESAASSINKSANGKMSVALGNIKKLPTGLTKGYGATKDALETQLNAEGDMMRAMVDVSRNLSTSIRNVSQSYKNIDKKMSGEMKYEEKQ